MCWLVAGNSKNSQDSDWGAGTAKSDFIRRKNRLRNKDKENTKKYKTQ